MRGHASLQRQQRCPKERLGSNRGEHHCTCGRAAAATCRREPRSVLQLQEDSAEACAADLPALMAPPSTAQTPAGPFKGWFLCYPAPAKHPQDTS